MTSTLSLVQPGTSVNDLLAAWEAIVAELEPGALDVEETELDDSTEGPSSGPKAAGH